MVLRPDEMAAQAEIERNEKLRSNVQSGIKKAVGYGATVAGAGLGARVLPFLSEFISPETALKGISKISPKVGDFLKRGMKSGLDLKEGLSFLKEKFEPSKSTSETSQNPIERLYPSLHQFLNQEIGKGRSPKEALGVAKVQGFKKEVEDVAKKLGGDLFNIIDQIYGVQSAAPSQGAQQPMEAAQPQQPGPGQQALMQILQKLQQTRGG